jgi:predicted phosphodiesterase
MDTVKAVGTIVNMYVGDIHGEIYLVENAIEKFEEEKYDKLIFIGDYVDSYDCTDVEIVHCLKEVINYKKANPKNVFLLLGNHDWQYYYIFEKWYRCSGRRENIAMELHDLFMSNNELFQIAHKDGKYLATHAGISSRWYGRYYDRLVYYADKYLDARGDIDQVLNKIKGTPDSWMLSSISEVRGGYGYGGPLWADKSEMGANDSSKHWTQIVGHTRVNDLTQVDNVTFIDCLRSRLNFLTVKL